MYRALQLASLGEGYTSPNPVVGAVVLDPTGKLVGEGFHSHAGGPHAEVIALKQAGKGANGGTLVVSLEPCCHQGRTPPCTEAVIDSGITRVVVALNDPDPRVAGGGVTHLRQAGLEVITGVMEVEAAFQNRAFIHRCSTGRPWGVLKWAMSLDGRTALSNGKSKWISCKESRRWVHSLRSSCDALIVGGGTVRTDNPLLTTRGRRNPEPLRVVLSRSLDLPLKANLWDTQVAKTIVASGKNINETRSTDLPDQVEVVCLDASEPMALMDSLAKRGCNKVLWECGPSLASLAIDQGCVQEVAVFIAPKLMGGVPARTPLAELGFSSMDQLLEIQKLSVKGVGTDLLIKGYLNSTANSSQLVEKGD